MESSFREQELECARLFNSFGQTYHVCSPENFEIVFRNVEEFKDGMGILAICSKLFPGIRIYTFQLMNNHFHIILSGGKIEIDEFILYFKLRLQKYFDVAGRSVPIKKMEIKVFLIDNLDYFRAAVAYNNRNGFVINDNFSPYTYPWGANSCFFSRLMMNYYLKCRKALTVNEIRSIFHSKAGDNIKDLYSLDGCVSPLSFCDISAAEKTFRNEKQYFYFISKKVETYGEIAKSIGEMISFTDEDIYQVVCAKTMEICGSRNPAVLDSDSRIQIAKHLHYTYHANNKQIQRMLKIDRSILDSMF